MKQTIYSPEEEQNLMAQLWSPMIADDPLAFVMFAFPWGEAGKPLAKFQGPRRWQRRILRKVAKHIAEGKAIDIPKLLRIARASGRGIGKSALVAWLVFWFLTTRIGASVIISANTETQLRKITFSEISKWGAMAINSHWWEIVGITVSPAKWLKELVERDLKKGTGYWGCDGKLWSEENPDAYAGAHNHDGMMVIFDEASGIPDSIWSVANGYFTEPIPNRFWFAFSQGRRNSGYFFEIFNKKRELWDNEQIDARTVEGTDPQSYQEIIDEYGEDSDEARVEVYGMFPENDDISFISPSLVEKAVKRELKDDLTAPIVIGVDPAGTGGDWFTIIVRQGHKVIEIQRYKLSDDEIGTMEGVGHVIGAIEEFRPQITAVDETGMGGPIGDRLREQGYKVRKVNFAWKSSKPQRFGNKRAEMWSEMKKWLESGQIPDDKRLKADLQGPKKKPDSKGVMFLESKKDMKARGLASPDAGDGLALTFAFKVAKRESSGYNGASKQKQGSDLHYAHHSQGGWMGH
jgi:hypothetical protein